jgi:hypothetical protein
MRLNDRQLGTVLAALRFWQRTTVVAPKGPLPEDDISTDGGTCNPLDANEIDTLCEELNCGGWRSVSVPGGRQHVRAMHEMLVEEKKLLREWADMIESYVNGVDPGNAGVGLPNPESLRFHADEINKLIEEGLPKKFRKQEDAKQ